MRALSQKGFTSLEAILVVIIVAAIGGIGYYVHHSQQQADKTLNSAQAESNSTPKTTSSIKTFADCEAARGSILQTSFPEVCVTKDGGKFVESPKYDASVCDAKIHDDLIQGAKGTFVSYDSKSNQISYKLANTDETVTNGWCTTPQVEDSNNLTIKLSELKAGDSISLTIAWDGIVTIQKN